MVLAIEKAEEVCANCRHFVQHYRLENGVFRAINAGHCIEPRMKDMKPGNTCPRFEREGESE